MIRILSTTAILVALSLSTLTGAQAGPRFGGGYSHVEHSDYGNYHDYRGDRGFDRHDDRGYRSDRHDDRGYHGDRYDYRRDYRW